MKKLKIKGRHKLSGTIKISGAKNSAVALIPAAILASGKSTICNVPDISDTVSLTEILKHLGVSVKRDGDLMMIDSCEVNNIEIPQTLAKKLRASYYFMGALLGRFKTVTMSFPGGCSIGERPIDLHLKGFELLGAKITNNGNTYTVSAEKLRGNKIYLDFASVGATINIMLAAVYAEGITIIDNAAKEPEIVNVATFLSNMGAKITGAGTSTIKIEGVKKLNGCFTEVIPDRIEAGTYLIAGAICGKNLMIENIIPKHIESLISKLKDMGIDMKIGDDYIIVSRPNEIISTDIKTAIYPGFPTDLQQPFMALTTQASGTSVIEENIWENRFMQVEFLNKMGANITVKGKRATVMGPVELIGSEVVATDLRAGACMVIVALSARGETIINDVEHILRGYESIVEKLTNVGAKIELIDV